MFKRKLKSESGSVTIEATISLSAFMFAIVTILTIVNICIAQARISYALNATAQEISQYSYLYSLTGFNQSHSELNNAGKEDTQDADQIFNDINTVYNEIEGLKDKDKNSSSGVDDITKEWNKISESLNNVQDAGSSIQSSIENIASDPKKVIFGVAKLAGSKAIDKGKSQLIMKPLAKAMCKKHLVNTENGDVDAYLKFLGVVPNAKGSYYDSLDFSASTLFPEGSNEITVNVKYNIKVIALLPIDFSFHFEQTAITHGWLAGDNSYVSDTSRGDKYVENDTLWTEADAKDRAKYIRDLAFKDLKKQGYNSLAYPYNTDGILYNESKKEFVMPRSWNPLSGLEDGNINDLNEKVMQEYIESLCGKLNSNEFGSTVTVKVDKQDGTDEKKDVNCDGASKKIILTIPEDEGLKEKIQAVIDKSDTDGVKIELNPNYGNGAKKTAVKEGASE